MQAPINFDPPHNGTATSRLAAESMRGQTSQLRAKILAAIKRASLDGLTCDEAEIRLGLSHQTCSARINELGKLGDIVPAGRRRTRSGRAATVWVGA